MCGNYAVKSTTRFRARFSRTIPNFSRIRLGILAFGAGNGKVCAMSYIVSQTSTDIQKLVTGAADSRGRRALGRVHNAGVSDRQD